jgi:acyl carrier protein
MIDEKKLKNLIAKTLNIKLDKITLNSGMNSLEEWDSLAHLSILTELDKLSKGKASKIKGLSQATSIKEIFKLLKKNKLA